jgi:hypothetical protein
MKKTYEHIGTIDLEQIVAITPNRYSSNGAINYQNFSIYLKNGSKIDIGFTLINTNPDSEELINFRKIYAEFVNDFLSLNIPANI